jgi:hypothetical protein
LPSSRGCRTSPHNGFLARFDDTEELLERAEQLAKDPSALPEIGRRARETACALSWERIADQAGTGWEHQPLTSSAHPGACPQGGVFGNRQLALAE